MLLLLFDRLKIMNLYLTLLNFNAALLDSFGYTVVSELKMYMFLNYNLLLPFRR
jgi:hypothetical protein